MSDSFTRLILLHHYRKAQPAIDESDFLSHGQCIATRFVANGATAGSGALEFSDQSVVKVPLASHWEQLRAVIIDVMVRFDGAITQPRNIVEADGLFAFFVAPDASLRFDMLSLVNGQVTPVWNGVSTVDHALAAPWIAQEARWQRLRVAFDGLSTAKIWVDGILTAQRNDFRSSLGTPGSDGISIGNWTLSNQHPLNGALDYVAIWKLDEDQATRNFVERLDPDAQRKWGRFLQCLSEQLGDFEFESSIRKYQDLLVDIAQCVANADESVRQDFYKSLDAYQEMWAQNRIGDGRYAALLRRILELLSQLCDPSLANRFETLANALSEIVGRGTNCFSDSNIDTADPQWRSAIEQFA